MASKEKEETREAKRVTFPKLLEQQDEGQRDEMWMGQVWGSPVKHPAG